MQRGGTDANLGWVKFQSNWSWNQGPSRRVVPIPFQGLLCSFLLVPLVPLIFLVNLFRSSFLALFLIFLFFPGFLSVSHSPSFSSRNPPSSPRFTVSNLAAHRCAPKIVRTVSSCSVSRNPVLASGQYPPEFSVFRHSGKHLVRLGSIK